MWEERNLSNTMHQGWRDTETALGERGPRETAEQGTGTCQSPSWLCSRDWAAAHPAPPGLQELGPLSPPRPLSCDCRGQHTDPFLPQFGLRISETTSKSSDCIMCLDITSGSVQSSTLQLSVLLTCQRACTRRQHIHTAGVGKQTVNGQDCHLSTPVLCSHHN